MSIDTECLTYIIEATKLKTVLDIGNTPHYVCYYSYRMRKEVDTNFSFNFHINNIKRR